MAAVECNELSVLLVILLAFAVLVAGMFVDDWVKMDTLSIGPLRICTNDGNCQFILQENILLKGSAWLFVCGAVTSVASLVMSVCLLLIKTKSKKKIILTIIMVSSTISGSCTLCGVLMWVSKYSFEGLSEARFAGGWTLMPFSVILCLLHAAAAGFMRKVPVQRYKCSSNGKLNSAAVEVVELEACYPTNNDISSQPNGSSVTDKPSSRSNKDEIPVEDNKSFAMQNTNECVNNTHQSKIEKGKFQTSEADQAMTCDKVRPTETYTVELTQSDMQLHPQKSDVSSPEKVNNHVIDKDETLKNENHKACCDVPSAQETLMRDDITLEESEEPCTVN